MKQRAFIFKVLLFLGIGFYLLSCQSSGKQSNRDYLNESGKLAIGIYLGRTVKDSRTKSVVYEYHVDNKYFQKSDGFCYLDSDKAKDHFYFTKYPLLKGNEFVVLYDSVNPEISIIRLDYPLRDSTDFTSYIREFKKNPN